ncbi:MAG: histidine--tRNA ligase [Candidatus Magasanikbacteria bacterium RIFCSPLOWO2_12_FULL_47_9b]|nr:MAG: histidine--tRNA ligase [Candidatus Magasanikbacteria bacterium RIFCSPLOWO2_02_FULL_47_16]OGH80293.1 MAG: histidine--tRNA ligase [Candidatus Magasanikbacteria bacterium RIFCSPHIGHO2_02_FULL_48_18]OGH81996.1 MAG: histidine--tRNA ligase [Candidatus Magasanikbacteria bacterium RIFCSPLOWO2_12_FULL_47_9b]
MKDIVPKEGGYWRLVSTKAAAIAEAYEFVYAETPIVEQAALFVRSLGKGTDVVEKEMYFFEDHDGNRLCLRPEMTAAFARAYISHGMHSLSQPVKLWNIGPLFRHDRPQAGRYRQFHQFNCESFGVRDPAIDAELVSVAYHFLKDLGIASLVHMNSIGNTEDRGRYVVELTAYLRTKRSYLSELSKKRITKNPLRVLDSKEEQDQPIIEEAPQIVDWLSDESKKHFMQVLEYLDALNIPYALRPTLVRGLDYYTDTVFEIYEAEGETSSEPAQALGGGGRYDLLVEQLGGQPTPGAGFALGLERVISLVRKQYQKEDGTGGLPEQRSPFFFAHLGEQARQRALPLIEDLRQDGILVHHNVAKPALKSQLELANKLHVSHAVILGHKELQDGTIIIRDMASGIQEIIDQKKLRRELRKILEKQAAS